MNTDATEPAKPRPRFYDVCLMYDLDYPTLQAIADKAGVDKSIIEAMFVSVAIHRADALKILSAFSEHMGKTWTFDDMKVALLPTFEEIYTTHQLDCALLATDSSVAYATIDMMRTSEPVSERDARL